MALLSNRILELEAELINLQSQQEDIESKRHEINIRLEELRNITGIGILKRDQGISNIGRPKGSTEYTKEQIDYLQNCVNKNKNMHWIISSFNKKFNTQIKQNSRQLYNLMNRQGLIQKELAEPKIKENKKSEYKPRTQKKKWNDEIIDHLRKKAPTMNKEELLEEIKSKFDFDTNKTTLSFYLSLNHIKAVKAKTGKKSGTENKKISGTDKVPNIVSLIKGNPNLQNKNHKDPGNSTITKYIKENYSSMNLNQIRNEVGERFGIWLSPGQIEQRYRGSRNKETDMSEELGQEDPTLNLDDIEDEEN